MCDYKCSDNSNFTKHKKIHIGKNHITVVMLEPTHLDF
jgi:hypothetical protein